MEKIEELTLLVKCSLLLLLFVGSPFDDHVILHQELFKVFQTSGSNVYEFDFDEFDLGKPWSKKFEITDQSKQSLKINLKTSDATKIPPKNIVLSYKKTEDL